MARPRRNLVEALGAIAQEDLNAYYEANDWCHCRDCYFPTVNKALYDVAFNHLVDQFIILCGFKIPALFDKTAFGARLRKEDAVYAHLFREFIRPQTKRVVCDRCL